VTEPVIHLATSAFTAAGWPGSFYPESLKPADYLSYYATQFDTVELDNTFYRIPSESVVRGWDSKTPPGSIFVAKAPQVSSPLPTMIITRGTVLRQRGSLRRCGRRNGPRRQRPNAQRI
jgi:uncharacterized protein YecE (DUF72 family)